MSHSGLISPSPSTRRGAAVARDRLPSDAAAPLSRTRFLRIENRVNAPQNACCRGLVQNNIFEELVEIVNTSASVMRIGSFNLFEVAAKATNAQAGSRVPPSLRAEAPAPPAYTGRPAARTDGSVQWVCIQGRWRELAGGEGKRNGEGERRTGALRGPSKGSRECTDRSAHRSLPQIGDCNVLEVRAQVAAGVSIGNGCAVGLCPWCWSAAVSSRAPPQQPLHMPAGRCDARSGGNAAGYNAAVHMPPRAQRFLPVTEP